MVLGGEPLKQALAEVATRALAETNELGNIGGTTAAIDDFTATLRGVVSQTQLFGEAWSRRSTLIGRGEALGLTAEKTQEILEHAQEIGRTMGLKVKELK